MNLSKEKLLSLSENYGDAFYLLDIDQLTLNYTELLSAFRFHYPNSHIAYSYKTNYIPIVCKQIANLGGYSEVVSEMECDLAKRIGVDAKKIILNGPVKNRTAVEELLLGGGIMNIDSETEISLLEGICVANPCTEFRVGIRCNFDVSDRHISRFGIDINSEEFSRVLNSIKRNKCLQLSGLHCHFAERSLDIWRNKVSGMLDLLKRPDFKDLQYVDFGGGIYGKMRASLKAQFSARIPNYMEYADVIAAPFAEYFKDIENQPKLFIEPGSALCGDIMKFVTKVVSIKTIRSKPIATLSGSIYNINPTLSKKNLPISVYNVADNSKYFSDMDFGGYTCIESDYLYRGYTGELDVGDFVVFDNAGSYSVVLKPPFILPNFPIICLDSKTGEDRQIKRGEVFEDIFDTYSFE